VTDEIRPGEHAAGTTIMNINRYIHVQVVSHSYHSVDIFNVCMSVYHTLH
jgi:hypothetical protein